MSPLSGETGGGDFFCVCVGCMVWVGPCRGRGLAMW